MAPWGTHAHWDKSHQSKRYIWDSLLSLQGTFSKCLVSLFLNEVLAHAMAPVSPLVLRGLLEFLAKMNCCLGYIAIPAGSVLLKAHDLILLPRMG